MLMFCVSGLLLNHRSLIKDVNVSRKYLPIRYEYRKWNGGLLRGTLDLDKALVEDSLIMKASSLVCCFTAMEGYGSPITRLRASMTSMTDCL